MINLEKEIRQQPAALKNVIANNRETLETIVSEAKAARVAGIYFAARGTSDHACVYAQYLFGIMAGIPCALGTPSVFTQYNANINLKNMLVIGVSQSGKAADCMAVLEAAAKDGAITVALTNNEDSPMAKCAKYHLFCGVGPEISIAATKTFTAQAMLLAALAAVWSGNAKFMQELENVHTYAADFIENITPVVDKLAEKYMHISGAVVLGRGVSYPIALEGALKMLETNKLKMKGYPLSDFHHGPIAQVKAGDLVIVLAPSGVCEADANEMIGKLNAVGADVLAFTDEKNVSLVSCQKLVLPYTGSELTAPFMQVMAFQMLACKMTIQKGIDPDLAGVINKITITK